MDENRKAEAIWDLMRRVEKGDADAEQQLRQMADRYFDLPGLRFQLEAPL